VPLPQYSIGVDGGGTKTDLILVDRAGNVLARHSGPGSNPSQVGGVVARTVLHDALAALLADSTISQVDGAIAQTLLCMAGSPTFWQEAATELKTYGRVHTATDAAPVLELATGGGPGMVLHAGTGSFVGARAPDGHVHYAGGLGWKLGDAGSGFDIARRAIAHGVLELQGWLRPTALRDALVEHTGLREAAAITRFFHQDPAANQRLAAFAPRVSELAAQGCQPAQAAIASSLTDLVDVARAVAEKLFGDATVPCGVSGAVLNSPPAVFALKALADSHGWRARFHFLTAPPVEGVRQLLMKM
jgi:glucosamine kinase